MTEKFWIWLAWHLPPKLVKWCIRVALLECGHVREAVVPRNIKRPRGAKKLACYKCHN